MPRRGARAPPIGGGGNLHPGNGMCVCAHTRGRVAAAGAPWGVVSSGHGAQGGYEQDEGEAARTQTRSGEWERHALGLAEAHARCPAAHQRQLPTNPCYLKAKREEYDRNS